MNLSHDEVLQILQVLDTADLEYFELRVGDTVIIANRDGPPPRGGLINTANEPTRPREESPIETPASDVLTRPSNDERVPTDTGDNAQAGLVDVTAPVLGVFYRSPEPGAPPFTEVGRAVTEGDTLGLVEVMKMFSGVTAPTTGVIVEILSETGAFVEYGQTIFRIRPTAGA